MPIADVSGQGNGEPAQRGFAINADDNSDMPFLPRAVYVGVTGNVAVMLTDGSTLLFMGVSAGTFLPIRPKRVMSTGTTAGAMIGVY